MIELPFSLRRCRRYSRLVKTREPQLDDLKDMLIWLTQVNDQTDKLHLHSSPLWTLLDLFADSMNPLPRALRCDQITVR